MTRISLTSAMSDNLRALKLLSQQMDVTQERLSSGLKVNSAIDNASNFYQSRSLTNRAADLESLLDSMGQGIQTINAALEGIEAGTSFLEQMSSVAAQAAASPITSDTVDGAAGTGAAGKARAASTKTIAQYEAEGYGVVTDGMTASEISDLLAAKGKIVLAEDIKNLTASIEITTSGAIIEGNGHKITFNATEKKQAAILADGANRSVTITNLSIDVKGEKAYGIRAANGGSITIDNIMGINVDKNSLGAQRAVNGDADLFDGATNTEIIISSTAEGGIGANGLAATAASQFYVAGAGEEFEAGTWYLPSIGELMEMYGYTAASVSGYGTSGADAYNDSQMKIINTTLANMGSDATAMSGWYWSSSESSTDYSWRFNAYDGYRIGNDKPSNTNVRCFQLLENCFNPLSLSDGSTAAKPEVGDIMYVDGEGKLSWGKYGTYNTDKASKTAVGVVCDVNDSDGSVKIVNLKNLTFDSSGSAGNFDASDPYGGSVGYTYWSTSYTDVTGLDNIDSSSLTTRVKSGGTLDIKNEAFTIGGAGTGGGDGAGGAGDGTDTGGVSGTTTASYQTQFNSILNEYNTLIKDSSYQGINLLTGGKLDVTFNETRTNKFSVQGQNIASQGIGINVADWQALTDIAKSVKEIQNAITTLRDYASELGNNYSIIQTRQDFTSALIDVLETGSDKLVLADMNEESANYLALQTRQQLAINSLSLASQSAQSVLSLF